MDVDSLLQSVTSWAETRPDIVGLALVGSHARGEADPDSDVDVVILTPSPERLLEGTWASDFGRIQSSGVEDYGAVTSLRIFYAGGPEVEFVIARPSWASVPLDPGTRSVIQSGFRVLYDPERMLLQLSSS